MINTGKQSVQYSLKHTSSVGSSSLAPFGLLKFQPDTLCGQARVPFADSLVSLEIQRDRAFSELDYFTTKDGTSEKEKKSLLDIKERFCNNDKWELRVYFDFLDVDWVKKMMER